MRRLAATLFTFVLLSAPAAFAGDSTHDFAVKGMTCGMCKAAITKSVSNVEGVREVRVDPGAERVTVVAAEGVDTATLVAAIEAAGGYEAEPLASDS